MNPAAIEALYARLAPALLSLDQPWCVIGSAAMMITGAPVADCPDLDIMTTAAGAMALETAWEARRDQVHEPTSGEMFRSRFSGYAFPEGRVEVMGDLTLLRHGAWIPVAIPQGEAVALGRAVFNVPTLPAQIDLLKQFGRPKDLVRARALEAFAAGRSA